MTVCAKKGNIPPHSHTCKWGTKCCWSVISSVTSKELCFFKEFPNLDGADSIPIFRRNTRKHRNQRALQLDWEDESVSSSKTIPGCIQSETGCSQISRVFGFHYSSLQTRPQLTANTPPHPQCSSTVWLPPVLSAPEPQPVIYYLAVFCLTWVHTASHTVALSQAASSYL